MIIISYISIWRKDLDYSKLHKSSNANSSQNKSLGIKVKKPKKIPSKKVSERKLIWRRWKVSLLLSRNLKLQTKRYPSLLTFRFFFSFFFFFWAKCRLIVGSSVMYLPLTSNNVWSFIWIIIVGSSVELSKVGSQLRFLQTFSACVDVIGRWSTLVFPFSTPCSQ